MKTKAIYGILVITIFVLIILSNTRSNIYDKETYASEFEKLGVYDDINESAALGAVDNLHDFFREKQELNEFWNENEKSHLQDVKDLITKGNYLFYALIIAIVIVLYYFYKRDSKRYFNNISKIFIGVGVFTGAFQLFLLFFSRNFTPIFIRFHKIFFPQGNWIFSSGNMIKLFPEQFFRDMSIKILTDSLISGCILLVLGLVGIWYCRTKR